MNHSALESVFPWIKATAAIASLLALLLAAGCQQGGVQAKPAAEDPAEPPPTLKVITAQLEQWPKVVRVQGSLLADEHAVVGAKVAGRVKEVKVDLGSVVRQGDVLVTLDAEELDLRVQEAEAQLEQALAKLGLKPGDKEEALDRSKVPAVLQEEALCKEAKLNLKRAEALIDQQAMAVEDLQQRQAAVEVAEAKYRAALNEVGEQVALVGVRRAALGLAKQVRTDSVVLAPFDGVVQQRHVAPGTYLQVGQAVVSLVKTNPLRFRAGVPEREAVHVRLKQTAQINVEGETELVRGQVTRISPALDMSNRSLIVEVDLANPDSRLRVGLFAQAEIVLDPEARTLALPAGAIREFAGVEKVWLVRDGKAEEKAVQTGRRSGQRIEILQGISAGDVVAVDARKGRAGDVVAEPWEGQEGTRGQGDKGTGGRGEVSK